ncbi:accessory Sec system protein Asp2 [Staphylococcus epidermidis]
MARKFRVLQVGGHDLGSLFNQKSNVEWDYFCLLYTSDAADE